MATFTSNSKIVQHEGLTFDDVLLIPGYTDFTRSEIVLSTKFTKKHSIGLPLISSPMDTVTEVDMAVALGKRGGIGIIHRNLTVEDQASQVHKIKQEGILSAAAVGARSGVEDRIQGLIDAGVDVIVVDSAHGYTKAVIDTIKLIKKIKQDVEVIAGNVATYDGAKALIQAGADALRIGMGPGAICTTRIISGMGIPQITAIIETARAGKEFGVPVIADGGIKYSGDMVKAFAAGASTVMMGSFFAACEEAPGEIFELKREQVPSRFKSILKKDKELYKFKSYRGMGSIGAMNKGTSIKSEDEFHGKSYGDRVLVAEGVEGMVPLKGTVNEVVDQVIGGIKSGMFYVGSNTIHDLQDNAKFMKITQASLSESHPHDILVTNPGNNY